MPELLYYNRSDHPRMQLTYVVVCSCLLECYSKWNALLANGYTLKSTIECNGEIFAFLLNESELTRGLESRTSTTTIEEHESEEWHN